MSREPCSPGWRLARVACVCVAPGYLSHCCSWVLEHYGGELVFVRGTAKVNFPTAGAHNQVCGHACKGTRLYCKIQVQASVSWKKKLFFLPFLHLNIWVRAYFWTENAVSWKKEKEGRGFVLLTAWWSSLPRLLLVNNHAAFSLSSCVQSKWIPAHFSFKRP